MSDTRHGQFRYAKQIGAWGSFAHVELEVSDNFTGETVTVDVAGLETDPRSADWIAGANCGVRYALDQLPSTDRDVSIRITCLRTNPVDSTSTSVAFATCFAVWDAVEFVPERPPFLDENTKEFVFPALNS